MSHEQIPNKRDNQYDRTFPKPEVPDSELVELLFHENDMNDHAAIGPYIYLLYSKEIMTRDGKRYFPAFPRFIYEAAYEKYKEQSPGAASTQDLKMLISRGGFAITEIMNLLGPEEIERLYQEHLGL